MTRPRVLLMLAHSIEEYDQVRLLSGMGYDVFSLGAYIDPSNPLDDMRPPLPDAPHHPELKAVVDRIEPTPQNGDRLDLAKRSLPDEVLEWADVIIAHHLEQNWLWPQWRRIRHKRVIWRTVGQSGAGNEWAAIPYATDGLEIVRYSPREHNIPNFAGESALIRFYKDPEDFPEWTGENRWVLNVSQNPLERQEWVNLPWIAASLRGLPYSFVGKGTEAVGGVGKVPPDELIREMSWARAFLYTGTQPASYTLGLIEAMMAGAPVVSISPEWMRLMPYGPSLFEGHTIAPLFASTPLEAHDLLERILSDDSFARAVSRVSRSRALALFSRERAEKAWDGWLMERCPPDPDPEDLADIQYSREGSKA